MNPTEIAEATLRPDDAPDDANLTGSAHESPYSQYDGGWQINDEADATWAIVKIREARRIAADRNAPTLAVIAELDAARKSLMEGVDANNRAADERAEWYTAHLCAWHRRQYDADADPKHRATTSIRLGDATLKSRQTPGRVLDADVERLPRVLQRVKVEPDKKAIIAHIKATGEIPEGVSWEHPTRNYTVDL